MFRKSFSGVVSSLVALILAAGCGGGGHTSDPPAPATMRQLDARLATTAELPDGIKAFMAPQPNVSAQTLPPLQQAPCSSLKFSQVFFGYGPWPKLQGSSDLSKRLTQVIADPFAQVWSAGETVSVYAGNGAQQVMATLTHLASRCAAAAQVSNGLTTREHVVTLTGMGDQALDIEVRSTGPNGVILAGDWIVIRSGPCILLLDQQPIPGTRTTKYLQDAARTAWQVYKDKQ